MFISVRCGGVQQICMNVETRPTPDTHRSIRTCGLMACSLLAQVEMNSQAVAVVVAVTISVGAGVGGGAAACSSHNTLSESNSRKRQTLYPTTKHTSPSLGRTGRSRLGGFSLGARKRFRVYVKQFQKGAVGISSMLCKN